MPAFYKDGGVTTDADLKCLEALENLEILDLGFRSITDAGLEHLKGLTNLRELDLDGTAPGRRDAEGPRRTWQFAPRPATRRARVGLTPLRGFTRLRNLNLRGTGVGDADMEPLKGWSSCDR